MSSLRISLLLVFVLSTGLLKGQQYELSWKREAWIGASAFSLLAGDLLLSSRLQPLAPQDIASLQTSAVWRPDRPAISRFSSEASWRSDLGLLGAGVAVLAVSGVLAYKKTGDGPLAMGILLAEANLLTIAGTQIFKSGFGRSRPFVYNPLAPLELKIQKDARKSFFSGHTSLAAANSFFAAAVFSHHFPRSKWKPLVWGAAIAIPAWVGLERYQAGKHFPTDIAAGYAFGAACGWLVPYLHRKAAQRKRKDAEIW